LPMLRAMLLEFPHDPSTATLDRQYMLGENLLVAPIFNDEGSLEYYLPAGRWTNILDGREIEGPGWQHEQHGFDSLPLLARPGSLIPFGQRNDTPEYDWTTQTCFRLYALEDGHSAQASITAVDGRLAGTVSVSRGGDNYTISYSGRLQAIQVLLVLPNTPTVRRFALSGAGQARLVAAGIEVSLEMDKVVLTLD